MLHRRLASALVPLAVVSAILAHDGDPKALDVQPAYSGPGFRPGAPFGTGTGGDDHFLSGGGAPPLEFESEGVTLLSWVTLPEMAMGGGNDCWGYVSPSGREYAIMGQTLGTTFVDITNPTFPVIVASIPGPGSLWRDIKTYQTYAYAVSEGGDGIQVIDLSQIDLGTVTLLGTVTSGGNTSSHNVAIDEVSGYLYRCGGSGNGLRIYSLANPANPSFVASWSNRYVHDAQVVTYTEGQYAGKEIAFVCSGFGGGGSQTRFEVLDVTNKQNIFTRDTVFYTNRAYAHQVWISEDREYAFLNDELDENGTLPTTTYVIDIGDLDSTFEAANFTNGSQAIGHNLYTRGDFVFEANYRSGMRVFDVSDPLNSLEVASFDTWPGSDHDSFNGLWSCYPYFPSGVVIGSDREKGLFVWWVGDPLVSLSFPAGVPELIDSDGASVVVDIAELNPGEFAAGSAKLHFDTGTGFTEASLVPLGGSQFRADLPAMDCAAEVCWYVSGESQNGMEWRNPPTAPQDHFQSVSGFSQNVVFFDDMETDQGWTLGLPEDTATAGVWKRVAPLATSAQPNAGHSESGEKCMVTGQITDVDYGKTTLLSPRLQLGGLADPVVSYWRWYANALGLVVSNDRFRIWISNDDGANWVLAEVVGPYGAEVAGGWIYHSFHVRDFVEPTDEVRVKFVASDITPEQLIEAALDDFRVVDRHCDCNGNDVADDVDIQGGTSLDCNGNLVPDDCDIASGASADDDGDGVPDECDCLTQNYCATSPNSVGAGALIGNTGSTGIAAADFTLTATDCPPGQFGLFFYGPDQIQTAFGNGFICVGGSTIYRLTPPALIDGSGSASHLVDYGSPPELSGQIVSGATWNFQLWYRDPDDGGAAFNLSDGLMATFCP